MPDLPDVVTVGRADQRFSVMTRGLDSLLVRVYKPAVKERELDRVKKIDVRLQARPEAPEPGIERMGGDDEVPVVSDPGQVIE